jgi:cobalt-zinc-cadmium efflux system membrane fusion protein
MAVPNAAIMLIQGTPMVFKLEGNEFEPQPVEPGLKADGYTAITAGLDEDDTIAVAGVFQLKSLLLKSQIGDTD